MTAKTFYIPEYNLPRLEATIEKLNRKAKKLSTAPITLNVVGHEDREDSEFGPVRVYQVVIDGPEPVLNGWELIGKLEPASSGNVVKGILGKAEVPARFRDAPLWCDHCQTNRQRNSTWVLRHVERGEYKQVGNNCLADFTGHGDPQLIAERAEWLSLACEAAEDAGYDPDFLGGSREPERYYIDQYLAWVAATIKRHGWLSRGKAEYHTHATADMALSAWTKPNQYKENWEIFTPDSSDEQEAKAALVWARETLAAKPDKTEYEYNLVTICIETSIPYSWIGFAASLIPAYRREVEKQIRVEKEGGSEWLGTPKKRQAWGPLTVIHVYELESNYGYYPSAYYIYKFQDTAGNVLVWKTSGEYDWHQGDQVAGKATVKGHDVYKGVKQTTLTRCAFEVVEPVAA